MSEELPPLNDEESAPDTAADQPIPEAADEKPLPWEERPDVSKQGGVKSPVTSMLVVATVAFIGTLFMAALVWMVSRYSLTQQDLASNSSASFGDSSPQQTTPDPPEPTSPPVVATIDASSRARVISTQSQLDLLRANANRLSEMVDQYAELTNALLADESGRRVASDAKAVEVFAGLRQKPRITAQEVEGITRSVLALSELIEQAVEDETSRLQVDDAFTGQIREIRERVDRELPAVRSDLGLLRMLIRDAANREPAKVTLAEAVEQQAIDRAREEAARISEQVAKRREEFVAREVEARSAVEKVESEKRLAETRLVQQEKEAELAGLEVEERRLAGVIEAARRRAELERRFEKDRAQVLSTLTPFLAKGKKQLVKGKWRMTEQQQPVSLSGLQAVGALNDDQMGAQALFHAAGGFANDRPNGAFGEYIGGHIHDNRMPLALRAQRFLRDYGELMVDKGMLKP